MPVSEADAEPVQVLTLDRDEKNDRPVTLNLDVLNGLKKTIEEEGCDYVSIISVMGQWRTGKSFLLSLLMRYLRHRAWKETGGGAKGGSVPTTQEKAKPSEPWTYNTKEPPPIPEWIKHGNSDAIAEGAGGSNASRAFAWRGGGDKCTNGIWIWNKPFVLKSTDGSGKRVAVLIMDTQGAWDGTMDDDQNATIYGLTALVSSKLIYNITKNLNDNMMSQLDYFTSLAEKACGGVSEDQKPFGQLEFLVRDYGAYDDGWTIADCKKDAENQMNKFMGDEAGKTVQERSQRLRRCFREIDTFALSHPGLPVENKNFKGELSKIEPNFLHLLDAFVENFFSENFPRPSSPLGVDLRTDRFAQIFENFAQAFADHSNLAVDLRTAMVKVNMILEREKLVKEYKSWLEAEYPAIVVVEPEVLDKDLTEKTGDFRKRLLSMIAPFHLPQNESDEFVFQLEEEIKMANRNRLDTNNAQVDSATIKIVAAPFVGLAGFFVVTHAWLVAVGGAIGGWVSMKKNATKNKTEMCHPVVFKGIIDDGKNFASNRYKDLQAMQIALNRLDLNNVMGQLVGGARTLQNQYQGNASQGSLEDKKNQ